MSGAEWIIDRLPTRADGNGEGNVWMRLSPLTTMHFSVHWSYVGSAAPWQHAPSWRPTAEPAPTEPDRIAALEQRLADRIAYLEERTARSIHALEQRLSSWEQLFWAHKHEARPVSIPAEAQP